MLPSYRLGRLSSSFVISLHSPLTCYLFAQSRSYLDFYVGDHLLNQPFNYAVKFERLTAVDIHITVPRDVTPCSTVDRP